MSDTRDRRQANRADLAAQYNRPRSPTARHVLTRVLGTELANGYTTLEQADELMEWLELGRGDRLLDLGAGRGWPGGYISKRSSCHLVSTDLASEAVAAAREHIVRTHDGVETWLAAVSGTALPFPDAVFDGVVHTDVLC